ncbi:hypothetical protein Tco_0894673 [Tanacetum coccineum]|uniref:Uncharacterized protein n=1 Tax=Tanacetum coccineum TaxID=301880 RepID=A0ABQ5CFN1_9ASTR
MMRTAYIRLVSSPTHPLRITKKPSEKIPKGDPEEEPEEDPKKESEEEPNEEPKEASESGSNTLPPDYTTLNEEIDSDLDSTARSEAKADELEYTRESNV